VYVNLNPGTVGIRGLAPEDLVGLAARHGFGGVDFPAADVADEDEAARLAALAADAGLRWGLFWLPSDFLRVPDAEFDAGLERLRALLPVVRAAGCKRAYNHVWPGSDERPPDENRRWHVERLRRLVAVLDPAGVRLGLEFIGPKTLADRFRHPFIRTLPEALELADEADPRIGLVLDFFHWHTSGGTLDEVREVLPVARLVNVHANDARADRPRDAQQDLERAMPLETGVIDGPGLVRVLLEKGYDGPIIAEPFKPAKDRLASLPPDEAAAEVAACMNELVRRGA
jgi:sugar phosphate isomerase/epimerase